MSQSLSNILLHVVCSTKHRQNYLSDPDHRSTMTAYLIGTLRNVHCPSLATTVLGDHVHVLCNLHRTVSVAQLLEHLKSSSSARIKREINNSSAFQWQSGYGAFSVSQSNVEQVKEYVEQQEEHHRMRTFQEELRLLLQSMVLRTTSVTYGIKRPSRPVGPFVMCGCELLTQGCTLGYRIAPLRGTLDCRLHNL